MDEQIKTALQVLINYIQFDKTSAAMGSTPARRRGTRPSMKPNATAAPGTADSPIVTLENVSPPPSSKRARSHSPPPPPSVTTTATPKKKSVAPSTNSTSAKRQKRVHVKQPSGIESNAVAAESSAGNATTASDKLLEQIFNSPPRPISPISSPGADDTNTLFGDVTNNQPEDESDSSEEESDDDDDDSDDRDDDDTDNSCNDDAAEGFTKPVAEASEASTNTNDGEDSTDALDGNNRQLVSDVPSAPTTFVTPARIPTGNKVPRARIANLTALNILKQREEAIKKKIQTATEAEMIRAVKKALPKRYPPVEEEGNITTPKMVLVRGAPSQLEVVPLATNNQQQQQFAFSTPTPVSNTAISAPSRPPQAGEAQITTAESSPEPGCNKKKRSRKRRLVATEPAHMQLTPAQEGQAQMPTPSSGDSSRVAAVGPVKQKKRGRKLKVETIDLEQSDSVYQLISSTKTPVDNECPHEFVKISSAQNRCGDEIEQVMHVCRLCGVRE